MIETSRIPMLAAGLLLATVGPLGATASAGDVGDDLGLEGALAVAIEVGIPMPSLDVYSIHSLAYVRPVAVGTACVAACVAGPGVDLGTTGGDPSPPTGFRPGEHRFAGRISHGGDPNQTAPCEDHLLGPIVLSPADGVLDTQVVVWRRHQQGVALPGLPTIESWGPGHVEPLIIRTDCTGPSHFEGEDALEWPEGNTELILVSMFATVPLPQGGSSPVRDADN